MAKLVTITCPTSDVTIYYTLDGTTPSNESTQYTEPFVTYSDATVQAIGYKDNYLPSEVAVESVDVVIPTPTLEFVAGATCDEGTVQITNAEAYASYGAVTFYWTYDGTTPTKESTAVVDNSITCVGNYTYKVVAILDDESETSLEAECTVSTLQVQTPVITVTDSE